MHIKSFILNTNQRSSGINNYYIRGDYLFILSTEYKRTIHTLMFRGYNKIFINDE